MIIRCSFWSRIRVGCFEFGIARRPSRFGYTKRWRWLRPISTRAKFALNRCEWCWKRRDRHGRDRCSCFDGIEDVL